MSESITSPAEAQAQLEVFKNSIAYWMDVVGRIQTVTIGEEAIDDVQLAMLRAANLQGFVSLSRLREDSEVGKFDLRDPDNRLPRYAVSRAASALEKEKLGSIRPIPGEKKYRRFYINEGGRACLDRIETKIAKRVLSHIRARGDSSMRYYSFTNRLLRLTQYLRPRRVAIPQLHLGEQVIESNDPVRPEYHKIQASTAAVLGLSKSIPPEGSAGG